MIKIKNRKAIYIQNPKRSLEMKIREPAEIEEKYEELKEKVKYKGWTFLNNDKKNKEIILLRYENSNLKKEINKVEEKRKKFFCIKKRCNMD